MVDVLQAARDHEHAWLRRQATAIDPVRVDGLQVGEVVRTDTVPRVRDHNTLVLHPCPGLDGGAVADLLDAELGGRGLPHRRLHCDTADADRWADALGARGYDRTDTVVMTWAGGRLDAVPVHVETADRATVADAVRQVASAERDDDPDVLDQLVALATAQHDLGARVLVARVEGRPVGAVRLFPGVDVAQLEELRVEPAARGRGVGRALLAAALGAAAGLDLVFLTSDPDDWPTAWYERLGFRVRGRSSGFVRGAIEPPT